MDNPLIPRAPDAALLAQAKRELGFTPGILDYVAEAPWLARSQIAFFSARPAHLDARITELVSYVVALERDCRHLIGSIAAFLRLAGYTQDELRAVETRDYTRFTHQEARSFEHAVAVARGRGRDTLAAVPLTQAARAELTAHAALAVFGAHVATSLDLPPDRLEAFEKTLLAKLLRPLIRRGIKASRSQPRRASTADHGAVFARTIALVGDSPLHELARDTLAGAWASPSLSTDDKAGIVAAVAAALDAPALAAVARTLGANDRFAAYARATIARGSSADTDIRDAARTLPRDSRALLLDVIGTTALAHALARVDATLEGA